VKDYTAPHRKCYMSRPSEPSTALLMSPPSHPRSLTSTKHRHCAQQPSTGRFWAVRVTARRPPPYPFPAGSKVGKIDCDLILSRPDWAWTKSRGQVRPCAFVGDTIVACIPESTDWLHPLGLRHPPCSAADHTGRSKSCQSLISRGAREVLSAHPMHVWETQSVLTW